MNLEEEIIPIAISAESYNLRIANLVEHLLYLDDKFNPSNQTGVA